MISSIARLSTSHARSRDIRAFTHGDRRNDRHAFLLSKYEYDCFSALTAGAERAHGTRFRVLIKKRRKLVFVQMSAV
jgi:hypothetical protein